MVADITGVVSGSTITAPVAPTKGYDFQGWYKEAVLTTPWVFASDTVSADITLYAKWGAYDGSFSPGDTGPGGGKIFYVDPAGFTLYMDETDTIGISAHYLEAAPVDMTGTLAWASSGYTTTDIPGTGTAIGTGRKNTALILATDASAPAAKACYEYSNNGKTDWFLPSVDELNELYGI